ncbi:MAG: sodium:proton antiporter [Thiotrichales bacterium]|nr:sodium:proton antiporter [Gammaproteobacteria bacterium]MBT67798.1 sodium:proton antiporter [Thiotrichales bacterium]MDP6147204.1 Na+/H+ antiporter NhaC family protein [Gammaproteobacteria bacterium]HJL80262.1 Na+/H+ antiporter NhaC family protein [Gammaproteobacteria bacterium]HJM08857.1 Na+/H+ antiporter NhaC family protein [Gammaproteobacteria bacterium]
MIRKSVLSIFFTVFAASNLYANPDLSAPSVVLTDVSFSISVSGHDSERVCDYRLEVEENLIEPSRCNSGEDIEFEFLRFTKASSDSAKLILDANVVSQTSINVLPGWVSLMPPLISILMALVFRSVVPALFLGVWIGSFAITGFKFDSVLESLLNITSVYVKDALANPDHAAIIIFSLMIGGLVGIISKNGGMQGIVNNLSGFVNSSNRAQLATSSLGVAIFFDDYANTLVVGNTMRKVTDSLKISRAKLAFLVDATAAPIACVALITTWVGYQVGMIEISVSQISEIEQSAYSLYLNSILYSFYPLFMLLFVFLVAGTGKDFGKMYQYEVAARSGNDPSIEKKSKGYTNDDETKQLEPKDPSKARAYNAFIPILMFILATIAGLYTTGEGENVQDIIGSADAYTALLWGSLVGVMTGFMLTILQRILSLEETVQAWYEGVKFMIFAIIVLILAWSLAQTTEILQTANYLVSILGELLPVPLIPAVIFLLSAATAFATGSSWGTMGIFYPIVIPLAWQIMFINGVADMDHIHIIYSSVACVICGAVWGDHCSPISDTTIMSSMASGCNHIDHVSTQLPYALSVGTIALLLGTVPTGYGVSPLIMIPAGLCSIFILLSIFGKRVE